METSPYDCVTCSAAELTGETLRTIAEHWISSHPGYLRTLEVAWVIWNIQQLRDRGVSFG